MIELAREYNRSATAAVPRQRCRRLADFEGGRFDFVYSNIVLHIPPEYSSRYIRSSFVS
jgi:hypothetical protein